MTSRWQRIENLNVSRQFVQGDYYDEFHVNTIWERVDMR